AILLAILRVARVSPVSWPFILGFAGVFAAISYAMLRMARGGEFRGWHPLADMALSAAMISAILYGVGPTGHLLYVVYLIAPLQAALYLGQTEAWQALLVNLTGFGLATAVRRRREPDHRRDRRRGAPGPAPVSGPRRHGSTARRLLTGAAGRVSGDLRRRGAAERGHLAPAAAHRPRARRLGGRGGRRGAAA